MVSAPDGHAAAAHVDQMQLMSVAARKSWGDLADESDTLPPIRGIFEKARLGCAPSSVDEAPI